jgi:flavodoxin
MNIMIVYDSIFGNTEKIAHAMSKAIASRENVGAIRVSNIKQEQLSGLDVLIVGSPTRAFRPTKNINIFLKRIPNNSLKGVRVAAFDTRISTNDIQSSVLSFLIKLFGYAAKPIAHKLKKKGGNLVVEPEGFIVKGAEGPLKDDEIERAADWVKHIIKI